MKNTVKKHCKNIPNKYYSGLKIENKILILFSPKII